MRKLLLFLLAAAPALTAQPVITPAPQQCVWRAGDNPAWAAPYLDESGWQPYSSWKLNPSEPRIWIRCHADLSPLSRMDRPAIQVTLAAAYQLYINGKSVGIAGNLRSGQFSLSIVRTHLLAQTAVSAQPSVIALRIAYRYSDPTQIVSDLSAGIAAGDAEALNWRRSNLVQEQLPAALRNLVWYGAVGVIGLVLLALFLYDRSRREVLILGIACLSTAGIFVTFFLKATLADIPAAAVISALLATAFAASLTQIWFPFAAAQRRVPLLFWILFAGSRAWQCPLYIFGTFLSPAHSLWLDGVSRTTWIRDSGILCQIAIQTSSFVAFWPYRRIARSRIPIAVVCMVWGATMMVYFSGWFFYSVHFYDVMDPMQALVVLCATAALLGLLFREQQRTAQERAELAGEMQAASSIQHMLAPAVLETAPSLHIDVAFSPMREVGGDFYLCRVLPDGRQRILIGDVSGKGAAAAMAATLLLGAASARGSDPPAILLAHLNRVLRENHLSGFATCLCADIVPNGTVTVANAGHLPPYRNGEEIPLDSGFPLGITRDAEYAETTLILAPGDALTLLSDGVVEARNFTGELFGFERTAAISTQSAESIASAAQAFGQDDDITVLTLIRLPVPAQSTAQPQASPLA